MSILLSISAVIALGVYRPCGPHLLPLTFPLNDGGLFYTMVQDLQRAHYQLPAFTSYNAADIPFTYSPFGLYVAAILNDITRISLTNLLPFRSPARRDVHDARFLPARPLHSQIEARGGCGDRLAFALIPRCFIWLIMGGGMTRAFGFLFAILALYYGARDVRARARSRLVVPTALFSGLTILSHLETGKFLAYSMVIFFICYGANRKGLIHAALVAARHGADHRALVDHRRRLSWHRALPGGEPDRLVYLHGARGPAEYPQHDPCLRPRHERALFLVARHLRLARRAHLRRSLPRHRVPRREYLLPALPIWWLVIVLLDNRAANTYTTIPVALCAGVGLAEMVIPALNRAIGDFPTSGRSRSRSMARARSRRTWAAFAAPLARRPRLWLAALVLHLGRIDDEHERLRRSPRAHRPRAGATATAMQWVAQETPAGSRFVVVSGKGIWPSEMISEWFPALSQPYQPRHAAGVRVDAG